MFGRMTLSLCVFVVCAGATFAQTTEVLPQVSGPPSLTEGAEPFSLFPRDWAVPGGDRNFWASSDYLFAWLRGADLPPLVTTSLAGTPRTSAGKLGPNTTVLFPTGRVDADLRSGVRLNMDYWFGPDPKFGLEAGAMAVANQDNTFTASSNGSPILALPFKNFLTGLNSAKLIAFPGVGTGSVAVQADSSAFYEGHLDIVEKAVNVGWFRLDALIGYRFYSYSESVGLQQNFFPTGRQFIPGTQMIANDTFGTRNTFHGLDMGLRPEFVWDSFSLELLGKVAVGNLNEEVSILGNQLVTVPGGAPAARSGGFFTQSSNIGYYHNNRIYAMFEGGAALNWQVLANLKLRLGYSILQLDGVARAGNQIDTTINPALAAGVLGGGNRPVFVLNRTDLWVQTISLGVVFAY